MTEIDSVCTVMCVTEGLRTYEVQRVCRYVNERV